VPVLKQLLPQNRFFSNRFPRPPQILLWINRGIDQQSRLKTVVSPPSLMGLIPGSSEPGIFYCLSYLRRINRGFDYGAA
jgi:hypothetical protein